MESLYKEVYFDKYCLSCKFLNAVDEGGFLVLACESCMSEPANINSHKPVNYKKVVK